MNKKKSNFKKLLIFTISIIFLINFTSAIPDIQILSPQNVTYNSTKILFNLTSNEPVNFFIKDERTGKDKILAENVTFLKSNIYIKTGGYKLTIWANNSDGTINKSVSFNNVHHNPVEINECGYLMSSDTSYILGSDVSEPGVYDCIAIISLRNVSLNLNGHTLNSGTTHNLDIFYVSDVEVFNGTLNGSAYSLKASYPRMIEIGGPKLRFHDLFINGHIGIYAAGGIDDVVFENVKINSSLGFWHYSTTNTYFINSSIMWNGFDTSTNLRSPATGIFDQSDYSSIILENTTISGFPEYNFYLNDAIYSDYFLRNSKINFSKIKYPQNTADIRFFTQHLIIINITDQFNLTGACSVRALDNGIFTRGARADSSFSTLSNPTAKLYIPTEEIGVGEAWLTEKLTLARTSSPVNITEYDFSPYNLTTRGWGSESDSNTPLNLTGINSVIYVDLKINTSPKETDLPLCTISQMLDLNNDEEINIQDAVIILRKISSLPISIQENNKNCKGISLSPF